MKKTKNIITTAAIVLGLVFYYYESNYLSRELPSDTSATRSQVYNAFQNQRSDTQVRGEGYVAKVLSDDIKGSKHQRFILKLPSGITVLVAHNIDLAPRIPRLKEGDNVAFFGEYEWNDKGGVIHWTHHDPRGKHIGGWLKHKGNTYE